MIPFTDPFRYVPHPLVRKAAREVVERLDRQIAEGELPSEVAKGFREGKMLGVLICEDRTLAAFSGSVGGTSIVEGFVPPIFDLTEDKGYYRIHEAEITEINRPIEELINHWLEPAISALQESETCRDKEIEELRQLKKKASGIAESQFANGQIKRAKDRWKTVISEKESKIQDIRSKVAALKKQRAAMSDRLQRWIFSQYIVHNASGEKASILEIFQSQGIIPPGGTGDCAAPKLLEHAFRNGLRPVAMGDFWYGKSPSTAVRTHGHFYPSCTSKCGPLLGFMMRGLFTNSLNAEVGGDVIYEDEDILVAVKPSGMPSVPGLDGRQSLQEWLMETRGSQVEGIRAVHRLDMDTSGLLLFAKTAEAAVHMQRQFEEHTIHKTYHAKLPVSESGKELKAGDNGEISLPLSPDYDERPRQKVDHGQGKAALTRYEVISVAEDGTTDIIFHPQTGRTHQLRVHAAHTLGLGRPIVGDMLYGGSPASHLHLYAQSITFRHPASPSTLFTITRNSDI